MSALRCMGEEYIDKVMPDCVKILVNECNTLGETLMRHTLHQYATFSRDDGKGGRLITL